jgi:hypothetical protein
LLFICVANNKWRRLKGSFFHRQGGVVKRASDVVVRHERHQGRQRVLPPMRRLRLSRREDDVKEQRQLVFILVTTITKTVIIQIYSLDSRYMEIKLAKMAKATFV